METLLREWVVRYGCYQTRISAGEIRAGHGGPAVSDFRLEGSLDGNVP